MSDTQSEYNERRAGIIRAVQLQTGIDEKMIRTLVHGFYARVRQDPLLGPIFDERISDWDLHLQRMCDFWSSVTLMSGRFSGSPMQKHMLLPIEATHFDHWLQLFESTAGEVCTPAAAEYFLERAQRIAQSLELGVANAHGVVLGKGERYACPAAQGLSLEATSP